MTTDAAGRLRVACGCIRLQTPRLYLRPPELGDAGAIGRLAGERAIAEGTLSIPHPYSLALAQQWIKAQRDARECAEQYQFAIVERGSLRLIGVTGLRLNPHCACPGNGERFRLAELGCWIGRPYWGRGYATEAGRAIVDFGFERLGLHRLQSHCFADNAAAAAVLEKLGMRCEGLLRRQTVRLGAVRDLCLYGLLAEEWRSSD